MLLGMARSKLLRWLFVVALLAGSPAAAQSPHGLLWNRSGLPAVFPLQVQTAPGEDRSLLLIDAQTGEQVLAAFIEGGRFFRVLVPPGRYRVRLASGDMWAEGERVEGERAEGERVESDAGPEQRGFELPEPLTFEVTGAGRKAGYRIDLRGGTDEVEVTSQGICQRLRLDPETLGQPWGWLGEDAPEPGKRAEKLLSGEERFPTPEYDVISRPCD